MFLSYHLETIKLGPQSLLLAQLRECQWADNAHFQYQPSHICT